MVLPEKHEQTINKLYAIAGPVIKYRIDSEIYDKKNLVLTDYYSNGNKEIDYWLTIHQKDRIHGKDDFFFENVASKLLDFGFSKNDIAFSDLFEYLLSDSYWSNNEAKQITMYPFFIRAGYQNNKNISLYFKTRIDRILSTIDKFGYSFQDKEQARIKKYENEFRFITDCLDEPLPTIYDIYAYAYYKNSDTSISKKIETIIQYVLNDEFQRIPEKAYVYDNKQKRYYAAGNVYHACLNEDRKLLNILLFSNFAAICTNQTLLKDINSLLTTRLDNNFFLFDKNLLKEQKNKYQIYSGAHMGLAENRNKKETFEIESTFYMLKILSNLHRNGVKIDEEV